MKLRLASFAAAACAAFLLLPVLATAQSTISGVVKDSSGAVMAGVNVQAASEALIEKQRTIITNNEGAYRIVDVRPGTYTMTFSFDGFSTVKQQTEVPANITVTVDASMKVGAAAETVNVDASIATVDIENVARTQTLSRTDMDSIPSARNIQSLGSLTPGVHLNTPDVGGSMQVQQTYMTAHGNPAHHDAVLLDGLLINTTQNDGQIQTYLDNAVVQETTYQTSNVSAEVSAGGVYTNMIPKDGGNTYHGELFAGFVPSRFVGSNGTPEVTARGLVGQSKVDQIQDIDGAIGGPAMKDKLWFVIAGRRQVSNLQSAGSFYPNGDPGIEKDHIETGTARLTYQINSKQKFAATWMRIWKTIGADIVSGAGGVTSTNPAVASLHRDPVMYYILQGRWTGALTSRLLVQAGWSLDKLDYAVTYQPGVQKTPFTPEWYAGAQRLDTVLGTRSVAGGVNNYYKFDRYAWNVSAGYILGAHQLKFGIQDSSGPAFANTIANGDAYYNYQNGVPINVTAYDTPTFSKPRLNHDMGLYVTDTWNYKRISVTGGLRWEYLSAQVDPSSAPAGRFVPARSFSQIDCNTIKGLGCFKNFTPRVGVVYDVFGTHKTALKFGIGKYNTPIVTSILNNFNPMFLTTQSLAWTDTNKNGYADGTYGEGELQANPNVAFGVLQDRKLDPNFKREYNIQMSAGIQQEVYKGVTLNFNWYRRQNYNGILTTNSAVPASAYTQTSIVNPLDGTSIPLFNLQPAFFGLKPALYQTNASTSDRTNVYNGFETAISARLPRGLFLMGGWTYDHQVDKACDKSTNNANLNDPNSLRFCDWTGKSNQDYGKSSAIPYRNEFKLTGSIPIKWGIQVSTSIYSAPVYSTNFTNNSGSADVINGPLGVFAGRQQGLQTVNWTITSSSRYPTDCSQCPNDATNSALKAIVAPGLRQGSTIIPLVAPGSRLTPQLNQIDMGIRKVFKFKEHQNLSAEAQIFNVINNSTVLTEVYTLGARVTPYLTGGPGGQVTVITNPRMLRLSLQYKF